MVDTSRPRLLIADDQSDIREALRLLFKNAGFAVETVDSPRAVLRAVEARDYQLVLIDLNYTRDTTSGAEGLELLEKLRSIDATLPVVVMTAWSHVELVVEAMRRGAADFVTKPWDNDRLLAVAKQQLERARAVRVYRDLQQRQQSGKETGPALIARSPAMRPVLEVIGRVGPSDANVLITGENGTGKGVTARALHAASIRASQPFVSVNIGGLAEGVFESELFGHARGAFTDAKTDRAGRFELAEGGTLFLDEIGNLPVSQQAKVLRTVETGEYERVGSSRTYHANVRLISATNADLPAEVAAGKFRQDLFFRLNTIHLHLPPLRERVEDIELLAEHFLKRHLARYRKPIAGFEASAVSALKAYSWPGNVRELDHAIERAVLMSPDRLIAVPALGLQAAPSVASLDTMSLDEVECYLIKKTMARYGGNARQAADALGLSRSAFYRRLEKYQL